MAKTSSESRSWDWLSPLVYLSSNWLSLTGVVIVTTATVLWLFLLPITLRGETAHPYVALNRPIRKERVAANHKRQYSCFRSKLNTPGG